MNDALKMQISAFVDGELPENEAELLLRRLNQDVAMRQQVAEYLALGRYMRRETGLAGMDALRGRIASALGEDPLPATQSLAPERSRFLKPAMGFALAASVAVLAVFGLRQSVLPDAADMVTRFANSQSDTAPAITQAPADEVVSEELRYMYRRHNASSADFGANGIITRLVTLELQDGQLQEVSPDNRRPISAESVNLETAIERLDENSDDREMQAD